jgi:uncharacterized membrane protein
MQFFGSSLFTIRSFSVVIGLLILPCFYWLSLELFRSRFIAGIAIMIIAISPFHIGISQEARMYSLWTLITIISSISLLRSLRFNNSYNWIIYSITLLLNLSVHLMTVFITVSHGLYILIIEGFRLTKSTILFLIISSLTYLSFFSWFFVLFINPSGFVSGASSSSGNIRQSLASIIHTVTLNLTYVFIDFFDFFRYYPDSKLNLLEYKQCLTLFITALSIYSLYKLIVETEKHIWGFILTLTLVPFLVLISTDIILGGYRSSRSRYLMPSYLGIELAISYCIASLINLTSNSGFQKNVGKFILASLVSLAVLSNTISSQMPVWWTKVWWSRFSLSDSLKSMEIINQNSNSLLVVSSPFQALSLSATRNENIKFWLIKDELKKHQKIDDYQSILITTAKGDSPPQLLGYTTKLIYPGTYITLWELNKSGLSEKIKY